MFEFILCRHISTTTATTDGFCLSTYLLCVSLLLNIFIFIFIKGRADMNIASTELLFIYPQSNLYVASYLIVFYSNSFDLNAL